MVWRSGVICSWMLFSFGVSGVGVMGVSEFWRSCVLLCVGLSFGLWCSGVLEFSFSFCFRRSEFWRFYMLLLGVGLSFGVLEFWSFASLLLWALGFGLVSGVWRSGVCPHLVDLAICRRQKGTIRFHGL